MFSANNKFHVFVRNLHQMIIFEEDDGDNYCWNWFICLKKWKNKFDIFLQKYIALSMHSFLMQNFLWARNFVFSSKTTVVLQRIFDSRYFQAIKMFCTCYIFQTLELSKIIRIQKFLFWIYCIKSVNETEEWQIC